MEDGTHLDFEADFENLVGVGNFFLFSKNSISLYQELKALKE